MSLYFDGRTVSNVNCGTTRGTVFNPNNPQTILFWFQAFNVQVQQILSKSLNSSVNGMLISLQSSRNIQFLINDSGGGVNYTVTGPNNSYNLGVWTAVAITFDGGTIARDGLAMYVNLARLTPASANSPTNGKSQVPSSNFLIGVGGPNNQPFFGLMSHVQVFNRVLSFQEIARATYYPGSVQTDLVGWWPLNGDNNPEPDYSGNKFFGVPGGSTVTRWTSDPPIGGLYVPRARRYPYTKPPVITVITFDTASSSGYEPALSNYSWSHTVYDHPNRILVVGVGIFAVGTVTSVKFNGVDLTFLRSDTGGIYRSELWYLVNPPVGTYTVEVTLNASLTSIGNAQSYWNVDQLNPIDANNGANGANTPASASVVTVADRDMVVGNLVTQTAAGVTSDGGQNSRTKNNGALGTDASDDEGIVTPPGSTALQWTGMGVLDAWAISLVALKEYSSPDNLIIIPPKRKLRLLMGVGL